MRFQQRANDRLIVSAVCIATGALLVTACMAPLVAAARQNPAVSRFLLGYTLLWSGLATWLQHSSAKTIAALMKALRETPRHTGTDEGIAEQSH